VTSLLDRAITLATEASNGTLNTTQEGAANQEYQSILSEINNIGQTTTYNQEQVFNGSDVAIYTGDSSSAGSSIDSLNIRTLSESSVGDSGGKMAYSSGSNTVFINLSTGTKNAQATDTLNPSGITTINVNYLVKGSNGSETTASTSITVGTGTSYSNTANGLISAINSAGLGMSASFATQTQAGLADGGTQTGIQITGGLISAGVDPATSSTSGILNLTGTAASALLTQGQTVVIQSGSTPAVSIVISSTVATLTELADTINTLDSQVTASLITNSDNSLSLSLADKLSSGGALSVTTTQGTVVPQITSTDVLSPNNPVSLTFSALPADTGTVGTYATATVGIAGVTNIASAPLSGDIVFSNGGGNVTISMDNASASADATHINLTTTNSTLTGLANAINGNSGIANSATAVAALDMTAVTGSTGLVLTSSATGTTIAGTASLNTTPSLGLTLQQPGTIAFAGTVGTTELEMSGGPGLTGTDALTAGTSIVVTNSSTDTPGTPITFVVGGSIANDNDATHQNEYFTGAAAETVNGLVGIMNAGAGALAAGLSSAQLSSPTDGNILLTANSVGTTITATSNVIDPLAMANGAVVPGQAQNLTGSTSQNASFTMASLVTQDTNHDPVTTTGDTLTGSIVLSNGNPGTGVTFLMSNNANQTVLNNTITLSGAQSNLTGLLNVINNTGGTTDIAAAATLVGNLGVTAAMTPTANGALNDVGLTFSTTKPGTIIGVNTAALFDASAMDFTTPVDGSGPQHATGELYLADGGTIVGGGGAYTGSVTITNGAVTDVFVMNSVAANAYSLTGSTINIAGTSLASLITAINTEGSGATLGGAGDGSLALTADPDAPTGGITVQSTAAGVTGLAGTSNLTATMVETPAQGTQGAAQVPSEIGASVVIGTGTSNLATDVVSGKLVITNSGGTNVATTFTMGAVANDPSNPDGTGLGTANVAVNGDTLQDLVNAINADSTGAYAGTLGVDLTAAPGSNGLTLTARDTVGGLSVLTLDGVHTSLIDQYGAAELTPNAGQAATGDTYASAVLGTTGSIGPTDQLSGGITLTNGGAAYTFTMAASSAASLGTNIYTDGYTLADLATAITDAGMGLTATPVGGALQLSSSNAGTSIMMTGGLLQDTVSESFTAGSPDPGTLHEFSTASVDLAGQLATAQPGDVLTGSITLTGTNGTKVFTMGGSSSLGTIAVGTSTSSETLQNLADAIYHSGIGITASVDSTGLALTMESYGNTPIIGGGLLYDTMGYAASSASLGSFSSESDTLSAGKISFTVGGSAESVTVTNGEKVSTLISDITADTATLGVTAGWVSTGNNGFGDVVLIANNYGTAGNITGASSNVTDTTTGAALIYSPAAAYNTGISNSTVNANSVSTAVYDSSSGQSNPNGVIPLMTEFEANSTQSAGVATISYSDGAGEALNGTDLTNQTDAESALNDLNIAISDVASQDGYIGAQINTLNSISQVMSTQDENVVSAQNAIQATDYASATANMSKYEILSQTGIAALAQANSVQQEVTKLLQ
jgi:flagellin